MTLFFQSLNAFAQAPAKATAPSAQVQNQVPTAPNNNTPAPQSPPTTASTVSQDSSTAVTQDQKPVVSVGEGLSKRDPFKLPEYIIIKIRQKLAMNLTQPGAIDESIEAIRRWPLPTYQLVGIIWDVNKPKAMFLDRNNSIHVLTVNDFIGNAKGVVTSIQSGSVTILEGRIPQKIKLKK